MSAAPAYSRDLPRNISRRMRLAGDIAGARSVLDSSRAALSENVADLVELLLVMCAERKPDIRGPREHISRLLQVVERSPAPRNRTVCNILLSACAREAARMGEGSAMRKDFVISTALRIWRDMTGISIGLDGSKRLAPVLAPRPDNASLVLMYKICGDRRRLKVVNALHDLCNSSIARPKQRPDLSFLLHPTKETAAAYILCLGKCRQSHEAERWYYSDHCASFRASKNMLSSLFQAHVASDGLTKAEALIIQHGAGFLDIHSCNAYLNRCSVLRLREKAIAFVDRMRKSSNFPKPDRRTYNILIKALCSRSGIEDASVGALRGTHVLEYMHRDGLQPSTVTYNTLLRNLSGQGRIEEAMDMYKAMDSPDHLTYSHLMLGAAKAGKLDIALALRDELDARNNVYPNYSFCKNFLEVIARAKGVEAAFNEAKVMVGRYSSALQVFSDVGGREAVRLALISACGAVGDLRSAFAALRLDLGGSEHHSGDLAPLYIATGLLQVCLDCDAHGQALEVFHSIKRAGLSPNYEVYERLIYGLVASDSDYNLFNNPFSIGADDFDWSGAHSRPEAEPNYSESTSGDDWGSNGSERVHEEQDYMLPESASGRVSFDSFDVAMGLLCEMHVSGAARTSRQAAYVYNSMIAAAGRRGDLDMASQIFIKMCRHNNTDVIYVPLENVKPSDSGADALKRSDIFQHSFEFPSATPGSYNSMIHAARICGKPELSFAVYDVMQSDRVNEPSLATYNLVTFVALQHPRVMGLPRIQNLLKCLDGLSMLTPDLKTKRNAIRKLALELHWSGRTNG